MNAYILNGMASHHFRQAIVKKLNINWNEIYKVVKSINQEGIIETKDGKKYKVELTELHESKF